MLLEGGYQCKLPSIHTTVAMSILNVHNLQNLILTIVCGCHYNDIIHNNMVN